MNVFIHSLLFKTLPLSLGSGVQLLKLEEWPILVPGLTHPSFHLPSFGPSTVTCSLGGPICLSQSVSLLCYQDFIMQQDSPARRPGVAMILAELGICYLNLPTLVPLVFSICHTEL